MPRIAPTDATLMMEPPPARIMCGIAYFITRKGAGQIGVHHMLPGVDSISTTFAMMPIAALLTTMSSLPPKATVVSTMCRTSSGLPDVCSANSNLAVRNVLRYFIQHFATASRDANLGALANKRLGNGSADARTASGDQCNFTLQSHASLLCLPLPRYGVARLSPVW